MRKVINLTVMSIAFWASGFFWAAWLWYNNTPIETTVVQTEPGHYDLEIRNTSDIPIHIKTTYLDDRDGTAGITTYTQNSGDPISEFSFANYLCRCDTFKTAVPLKGQYQELDYLYGEEVCHKWGDMSEEEKKAYWFDRTERSYEEKEALYNDFIRLTRKCKEVGE